MFVKWRQVSDDIKQIKNKAFAASRSFLSHWIKKKKKKTTVERVGEGTEVNQPQQEGVLQIERKTVNVTYAN